MAIDFARTFGAAPAAASAPSAADRAKAQVWLNIGYTARGAGENGADRFVSLPVGIPLDTQEPVKLQGRNEDYLAFTSARNDLLDQIMAAANKLQPGEEKVLNLEIQMRRVGEEQVATAPSENKFSRQLDI